MDYKEIIQEIDTLDKKRKELIERMNTIHLSDDETINYLRLADKKRKYIPLYKSKLMEFMILYLAEKDRKYTRTDFHEMAGIIETWNDNSFIDFAISESKLPKNTTADEMINIIKKDFIDNEVFSFKIDW